MPVFKDSHSYNVFQPMNDNRNEINLQFDSADIRNVFSLP